MKILPVNKGAGKRYILKSKGVFNARFELRMGVIDILRIHRLRT